MRSERRLAATFRRHRLHLTGLSATLGLLETGFIPTGIGTHGLYPSRDGTRLYISNRGSNKIHGAKAGPGSVSVLDFASRKVIANWPIPGGAARAWAT